MSRAKPLAVFIRGVVFGEKPPRRAPRRWHGRSASQVSRKAPGRREPPGGRTGRPGALRPRSGRGERVGGGEPARSAPRPGQSPLACQPARSALTEKKPPNKKSGKGADRGRGGRGATVAHGQALDAPAKLDTLHNACFANPKGAKRRGTPSEALA